MSSPRDETNAGAANTGRREFVQTAALAGASLAFAGAVRAGDRGDNDLNIALLGVGLQGRDRLLSDLLKMPHIRFKAVCDVWGYSRNYAANLLNKRGIPVNRYGDYREMLTKEKDLDAVIIATPDCFHAEHTIACLKAGAHVYCEKVMAVTLEQARQMVLAARATKKLLQIGHQRYSSTTYQHAARRLLGEAKLLGRITHCYGQWNRACQPDKGMAKTLEPVDQATLEQLGFGTMDRFLNWRHYKGLGNGPMGDLGAHQVGVFGWFLGTYPRTIVARGGVDYYANREWYDNVLAILEYETPQGVVRASYQVLTTTSARGYFETFMGVDGTLQISEMPSKCRVFSEGHLTDEKRSGHPWDKWATKKLILAEQQQEQPKPAENDVLAAMWSPPPKSWLFPNPPADSLHGPHLANFFDAIRNGTPLNCPAEVGYANMLTVMKINEAVAAGRAVECNAAEFSL